MRTHKAQRHFSPEEASTQGHQSNVASTNERQAQRKAAHATRKAKDTNFKSFLEVIQAAIEAAQETEALPAPMREMTNRLTRAVTPPLGIRRGQQLCNARAGMGADWRFTGAVQL